MSRRGVRIAASVLIVAALGLLVVGLQANATYVWVIGLGAAGVAMALSLATRWIGPEDEPPGSTKSGYSSGSTKSDDPDRKP